jgi:hypothetical protein
LHLIKKEKSRRKETREPFLKNHLNSKGDIFVIFSKKSQPGSKPSIKKRDVKISQLSDYQFVGDTGLLILLGRIRDLIWDLFSTKPQNQS